jgi:hypothetical protein
VGSALASRVQSPPIHAPARILTQFRNRYKFHRYFQVLCLPNAGAPRPKGAVAPPAASLRRRLAKRAAGAVAHRRLWHGRLAMVGLCKVKGEQFC